MFISFVRVRELTRRVPKSENYVWARARGAPLLSHTSGTGNGGGKCGGSVRIVEEANRGEGMLNCDMLARKV